MTENTDASTSDRTEFSDASPQRLGENASSACDACGTTHYDELHDVCLGETEYDVCGDCLQLLVEQVERYCTVVRFGIYSLRYVCVSRRWGYTTREP